MSTLLGAWSLTGEPVAQLMPSHARRKLLQAQVSFGERKCEFLQGRIWLTATTGRLIEGGLSCAAVEGFVVPGSLRAAYDDESYWPEGHYVMARVGVGQRWLQLGRSISGGERLFIARRGEVLIFASSLRPLLAYGDGEAAVNPRVACDVLLCGLPLSGAASLIEGIEEVLPGHYLLITETPRSQQWINQETFRSPVGTAATLAEEFRGNLYRAVDMAVGSERPIAVALSGGIDSSAIAAAAVEVAGAESVVAYTYEFDDPTHSRETAFARAVCRRLGIKRHRILSLDRDTFLNDIPEMIWRSESSVAWHKAFVLQLARRLREDGFRSYLSGFGVGSNMAYLAELAKVLSWLPCSDALLGYWKSAQFGGATHLYSLEGIHPGLAPPHPRLYHLVVRVLTASGRLRSLNQFYPKPMQPLLPDEDGVRLHRVTEGCSLLTHLQQEALSYLVSCIDVTRAEKASRGLGVCKIAPAHFRCCLPYAYFPTLPMPSLWSAERRLRPGKMLLQRAFRGILPDKVLYRKKSWEDAVASSTWIRAGRTRMLEAVPDFPDRFERYGPGTAKAVRFWEPQSILATGLALGIWEKMFLDAPRQKEIPTWERLLSSLTPPPRATARAGAT